MLCPTHLGIALETADNNDPYIMAVAMPEILADVIQDSEHAKAGGGQNQIDEIQTLPGKFAPVFRYNATAKQIPW